MFSPAPSFDSRHVAAHAATLAVTWTDSEGEPTSPTGAVSVVVIDANGTAVTSGTATVSTSAVTFAVAASLVTNVAWLYATWTDTAGVVARSTHEIVGGVYVGLAVARSLEPSLASYSTAEIRDGRAVAEAEAERLTRQSFVRRYARLELLSSRMDTLLVPWRPVTAVRSVTPYTSGLAGTAFTADELAAIRILDYGALVRTVGWSSSYAVEVEHGYQRPPADVVRAVARRAAYWCRQSTTPTADQQARFVIEDGRSIQLSTAGLNRTGDDIVDAIYKSYRHIPISVA